LSTTARTEDALRGRSIGSEEASRSIRPSDILYLTTRPPYPEQETEELGDDIVARLNPETDDVESLEIPFFSKRVQGDCFELPVTADFQRAR
jgi:hypothetical protein